MSFLPAVRPAWYAALAAAVVLVPALTSGVQPPSAAPLRYPATRVADQVDSYGGMQVRDPYRWLEDTASAETRSWVVAQNALAAEYLRPDSTRAMIRARLAALAPAERTTAPRKFGGKYFVLQQSAGQEQAALFIADSRDAIPRAVIDPNASAGGSAITLGKTEPSPNGKYVAYSVARAPVGPHEIRVREVSSGRDLPDTLRGVYMPQIAWTRDNDGFFYTHFGTTSAGAASPGSRREVLRYHRLGTPTDDDETILDSPESPGVRYDVRVSLDGEYAVIGLTEGAAVRNKVSFIDLSFAQNQVSAPVVRLIEMADANYTFVGNEATTFLFRTDAGAPRGRIIAIDIDAPNPETWRTLVRETPRVLVDATIADTRIVLTYLDMEKGLESLLLTSLRGSPSGAITLPGAGTVTEVTGGLDDAEMFYTFTSFLSPPTVYRHDLRRAMGVVHRRATPAPDLSRYETTQVFAQSQDGTRVPVFVTGRKERTPGTASPTLLMIGGGFDTLVTPAFSAEAVVWLEMGGVYAVAVGRGGGEYGATWREAGMLDSKRNAVDDLLAAADYLVAQKIASPTTLAVAGSGHGALVVSAALAQRPELFGAALLTDGVFDLARFPRFGAGWMWTDEYGSPADSAQARGLVALSPVHTVRPGTSYPPTFIAAAGRNGDVAAIHSLKFAAALQAAQRGNAPILLNIHPDAGNPREQTLSRWLDDATDRLAFAARQVGGRL